MEVKEGEDKPYFCLGEVHVRRGAYSQKLRKPADVRKIFDDAGKLNFDMGVCNWFRWEDVSEQAVREFKQQASLNSDASSKELITNLGLLLTDKGEMTNAVPMLFSDACGKRFISAIIHCVRFKGTENVHILPNNQEKCKEKSKEKTVDKVLRLIKANPRITTVELAAECNLKEHAIYKTVRKLRESGKIQRKGGDKGGEWIVLK